MTGQWSRAFSFHPASFAWVFLIAWLIYRRYFRPHKKIKWELPVAPVYVPPYQEPGFDYTPISMWGYFGYEILFSIPCVGFILLLVFSFGGTNNINVRNFARSYFCLLIILAVLFLLFAMFAGVSVAALS